ncbi:MAG: response regulator [Pyrinomonadaceae bacterium]
MLDARPKVLYLDDNPDSRTVIDSFLILLSIRVVKAHDPAEARVRVGKDQLDLILLDSYFGDEHGLKVCRELCAIYPGRPLIFYTDPVNNGQREKAIEAGATEFVSEPHFNPLLNSLGRYVNLSKYIRSAAY